MKLAPKSSTLLAVFAAMGLSAALGAACTQEEPDFATKPVALTQSELENPASCAECHPAHYKEWRGSMHAYAAEDPVFLAMNARMQRETNGAGKDFCVQCHAPLAVRKGLTTDGMNLAQVPSHLRGVTCLFCHTAEAIEGEHNAPVKLASDGMLRGAIADPAKSSPHKAGYSALHDRERPDSARLCGACHDVVTPKNVHLERTFAEWKASLYSKDSVAQRLTCGKCHMSGRDDLAADSPGVGIRKVHDHSMPGVDIALTDFPDRDIQKQRVQAFLDATLLAKLCVRQTPRGADVIVTLDNSFAGHGWPSGALQDRRAWVELRATRGGEALLESGVVPNKQAVAETKDPNLFLLRDQLFDENDREVHMFWKAARYKSSQLPPAVTADRNDPAFIHSVSKTYSLTGAQPDKVSMKVHIRPMDFDVLADLVASGDLDPAIADQIPTFTLSNTVLEWTKESGQECVP
jgi:hypothetical protein